MNPRIQAAGLTKIYPVEPLDRLAHLTFGRAVRGTISAHGPLHDKVAVDNVNLDFVSGDRIGIIGRNGAGKSTLLAMLAGMMAPTSGSITVEGHVTAVMTLGVGLREDLPGRENIYVDGEIQGKPRADVDRVIDETIAFADLGEFIDYPIRTYSTGMKARLAFAMIIHLDPEILIIDETLSVGDAFFSEKATRKIREICDRGKIVIIVSHGMQSIIDMCNRCLWLDSGRIMMDGDPHCVTAAYVESVRKADETELLHRFRGFLGTASSRAGYEISAVRTTNGRGREAQTIFRTRQDCNVQFEVTIASALHAPQLLLRIARMDGLLVCESAFPQERHAVNLSRPGRYEFDVVVGPLMLGNGVFEITAEMLDARGVVSTSATIIEVRLDKPPVGGRPLLVHPCRFQSEYKS